MKKSDTAGIKLNAGSTDGITHRSDFTCSVTLIENGNISNESNCLLDQKTFDQDNQENTVMNSTALDTLLVDSTGEEGDLQISPRTMEIDDWPREWPGVPNFGIDGDFDEYTDDCDPKIQYNFENENEINTEFYYKCKHFYSTGII